MKSTLCLLLTAALSFSGSALAQAQWPTRSLNLLTPFTPGPGPDLYLRPLMAKVGEQIGQVIVNDVRVGGGGALVLTQAARAAPDGHTLVVITNSNLIQRHLRPEGTHDAVDFAHVSRLSLAPALLVISAASPAQRLEDLVATAKASPGKLNYGSGGNGTPSHLQAATLQALTGIDAVHVPFKIAGDVIPSLVRGDLHFAFQVMSFGAPFVRSGKLRLLATTGAERARQFPDAPTLNELIKNDLSIQENWLGVAFPLKTPVPIVRRFHAEIIKALADPMVQKGMETSGTNASPSESPEEYSAYVRRESDKWREIVKLSGVKVE
ncbi:MAG: tripartite tricarboxylate transporter substrate binding protein [Betaproteobacteria bacterium]|nr:tripartite tricarboxylate transporter substrate binding protein [Betaproteobacteria bacterium]